MPAPTPNTRAQLEDLLVALISDPYNRQNSAANVRAIIRAVFNSSYNRAEDPLNPSTPPGAANFGTLTGVPEDNGPLDNRLAALRALPINQRFGAQKVFNYLTAAEAAAGNRGATLYPYLADPDKARRISLHEEAKVTFYRPDLTRPFTYAQKLVAVYDSATPPQFIGSQDGDFTIPLPLKLVPAESMEAIRAGFRQITDPEPDPAFMVGEFGLFTLGGQEGFYERRNNPNGVYGVPTGPRDANWVQRAPPLPASAYYQVLDLTTAIQMNRDRQVVPGRSYDILFGSVYVRVVGTAARQFAFWGLAGGLPVRVDVAGNYWEYTGPEVTDVLTRFAVSVPLVDKLYGVSDGLPAPTITYFRLTETSRWQPGGVTAGMLVAYNAVRVPPTGPAQVGTYDVGADLFTPDGAGGGGPTRDPYDVDRQKAIDVVAAYADAGGPFEETDAAYFGKSFTDDYNAPGDEFEYRCTPSRQAGGPAITTWKWRRYLEAGV